MKNRDDLRNQKIKEAEVKIERLHLRHPELRKINEEIGLLSMKRVRLSLSSKNALDFSEIDAKVSSLIKKKEDYLRENKIALDIYEPDWNCSKCEDRGYLKPGLLCECFKQEKYDSIFNASGIIGDMQNKKFENFDISFYPDQENMKKKVDRCKNFVINLIEKKKQNNLFFTGQVGRGKTHLSLAIANAALEKGVTVVYKRIDDLLDIIRDYKYESTYNSEEKNEQLQKLREVDLLVIDDLGTENTTNFAETQLRMLIEDRNILHKAWIINSNLLIEDLSEKYGERVTDRIIEKADLFYFESEYSIRELKKRKTLKVK